MVLSFCRLQGSLHPLLSGWNQWQAQQAKKIRGDDAPESPEGPLSPGEHLEEKPEC